MNSLKKILLIDGDHLFGNTIKTAFSPRKYKILVASTCMSGINMAFQLKPDLIFYNTNLDPLNGSTVFKALQLNSSLSHIPIIFYSDKNDVQIKNFIINNGNGALSKDTDSNRLPLFIENKGGVHKEIDHVPSYDFNALFNLSPNGLFIFDKRGVLSINQKLVNLLKYEIPEVSTFSIKDFIDNPSLRAIKQWMKDYLKNNNVIFNQQVILKDRAGENIAMNLRIAELKRTEDSIHFLGTFQAVERTNPMFNYQLAHEVCNLLKRENMEVSEALEKKITHTIKLRAINEDQPKKSFFTKRENEVLRLSMEGLSIKIIADKLSLSTRTVEKYRTKLMSKSGAKNIVEVIVFSIKNNLLKI